MKIIIQYDITWKAEQWIDNSLLEVVKGDFPFIKKSINTWLKEYEGLSLRGGIKWTH